MNSQVTNQFPKTPETHRVARRDGFTLIELLIVIAIIGLLATIGLPAIRGMTKSNALAAANRQLLDDIGLARQLAIANHTTVCMVFIPPNISSYTISPPNTYLQGIMSNLYSGQYTTYALIAMRTVGDQPGNPSQHYLTGWRTLPGGVYIATNKFFTVTTPALAPPFALATNVFNFPVSTNVMPNILYYIAFNFSGQLVRNPSQPTPSLTPEYIQLARGSIFYTDDGSGTGGLLADVAEAHAGDAYYVGYATTNALNNQPLPAPDDPTTFYNQIYIDPLTGRARVQRLDIQ